MNQMQRIIAKHQHTDGLIALFPQHQMSGNISYDFGPNQGHGTLSNVSSRYSSHSVTRGHYMNASGYDGKLSSYNDIHSATFANDGLLSNGGFETAGAGDPDFFANWTETAGDGVIAAEVVETLGVGTSAKLTAGATINTVIAESVVVVPGTKYRLRFFSEGDGTYAGRYQIYDATNAADIVAITTTGITGTDYVAVAVEFTAPADCISVTVYLWCPGTNGGIAYFDAVEVRPAGLGFNPDSGAIIAFIKTDAAWAELINRYVINLEADNSNKIQIWKSSTAGLFYFRHSAGGDSKLMSVDAMTTMDWFCVGLMWDLHVNDEVRIFMDGVDTDGGVGLGGWVGNLDSDLTVIGAQENDGSDCWDGGIGIVAVYNTIKTDAEMLYLSKP